MDRKDNITENDKEKFKNTIKIRGEKATSNIFETIRIIGNDRVKRIDKNKTKEEER